MKKQSIIAVCLLGLLLLSACGQAGPKDIPALREPAGMAQDITTVTRGEFYSVKALEGLVLPEIHELSFSQSAALSEVRVCVGMDVKQGDVLARLQASGAEAGLEAAKSQQEYAEKEWELVRQRQSLLIRIAQQEYQELKAAGASSAALRLKEISIEEQTAALEEADALWELTRQERESSIAALEAQVEASVMLAPCDGTVVYCTAAEGGYAMQGAPLIWLAASGSNTLRTPYLTADAVSQADEVYAMVAGQRVEVEYIPLERAEYLAQVAAGYDMYSRFRVVDAGGAPIQDGMKVVLFLLSDRIENALLLPSDAVRRDSGGFYVYRMVNGAQQRQAVTRGAFNDALVQITAGLEEGDQVYVGN